MNAGQSTSSQESQDWPTYELTYTFNPDAIGCEAAFEPDEVVIHDPASSGPGNGRWISAKRNAYLPVEELR